jgi:predicted metal-dependent enzyme (double-stranded beta helix superfamily)
VTAATTAQVLAALGVADGRALERPHLEHVVETLAGRPDLWTAHLPRRARERTYASLHRDAALDVWALFWVPGGDTGWHDHDRSSGAVRVVEGEVVEHALRVAGPERRTAYRAGTVFSFGPSHIHRLTCEIAQAVSIHAYSPPLWRLGQYAIDGDGALHRESVSYADELRPMDGVAA